MAYIKKGKKIKPVKPKKVKMVKEKVVTIGILGKNKKLAKVNIKPEDMGLVFFSETINSDKDGNPTLVRQVKMNKGKVVRETLYNMKNNEIEFKVREV